MDVSYIPIAKARGFTTHLISRLQDGRPRYLNISYHMPHPVFIFVFYHLYQHLPGTRIPASDSRLQPVPPDKIHYVYPLCLFLQFTMNSY